MWRPSRLALAYCGVVLLFAAGYGVVGVTSPGSFVVNTDVNKTPFERARANEAPEKRAQSVERNLTLQQIDALMKTYEAKLALINTLLRQLQDSLEGAKKAFQQAADRHQKALFENMEKSIAEELKDLRHKAEVMEVGIGLQEENAKTIQDSLVRVALESAIAEERVRLATLKFEAATKEVELRTKALKDLAPFADPELAASVKRYSEALNSLEALIYATRLLFLTVQKELDQKWGELALEKAQQLYPSDYLYFSVVTATTTGYGDIVPNTPLMRSLTMLEIVLCAVIFGCFLTAIGDSVKKGNTGVKATSSPGPSSQG
jgi:hypothetical protein